MQKFLDTFLYYLDNEDRENSLKSVIDELNNNIIDIVTLYTQILSPALNDFKESDGDEYYIWKEHIRSSIIRTIIENCYPYVIKERNSKYKKTINKKVAVVCPTEEYHEIGARMITDFFTLVGYDSIFVGSNTPTSQFISALDNIDLDYIAISVTNYYNFVATYKAIEKIKSKNKNIKVIVGGSAFEHNKHASKTIGADIYLNNFDDILNLAKGDQS